MHTYICTMGGSKGLGGWAGGPDPPEKSQNTCIGFLSNTGPDIPWKFVKLQSQHSMLGHHRHTSETPLKWRFADGPMMARLKWYFAPPSPHQQQQQKTTTKKQEQKNKTKQNKTKQKNNVAKVGPLTKRYGSAHVHVCSKSTHSFIRKSADKRQHRHRRDNA